MSAFSLGGHFQVSRHHHPIKSTAVAIVGKKKTTPKSSKHRAASLPLNHGAATPKSLDSSPL